MCVCVACFVVAAYSSIVFGSNREAPWDRTPQNEMLVGLGRWIVVV